MQTLTVIAIFFGLALTAAGCAGIQMVPPTPIPATATAAPPPMPSPTSTPDHTCECSSSADCNTEAWQTLIIWREPLIAEITGRQGSPLKVLACTQKTLRPSWIKAAELQQQTRQKDGKCDVNPDPETCKWGTTPQPACNDYWKDNWAVNDVATAWFIRARVLCALGQVDEGKKAYQEVIDKFSCGWAWDINGWWWRVADVANIEIDSCQ